MVQSQHRQSAQGEDGPQVIEIDVSNQLLLGNRGMRRKVSRAEEALFFARDDDEENSAFELLL